MALEFRKLLQRDTVFRRVYYSDFPSIAVAIQREHESGHFASRNTDMLVREYVVD